jgi:hypothetical protein
MGYMDDNVDCCEYSTRKQSRQFVKLPKELVSKQSAEKATISLPEDPHDRLQGMLKLNNLIQRYFLFDAIDKKRDSIVSCHSVGTFFLIVQLIDRLWPEARELSDEHHEVLAWWISVLLDDRYTASTSIQSLQRNRFLKHLQMVDEAHMNDLLSMVKSEIASQSTNEHVEVDPERAEHLRQKIVVWNSIHTKTVCHLPEQRYCDALLQMCISMQRYIERNTGQDWQQVCAVLNELHVVFVEVRGEQILLTTRPTPEQMSIMYRLNCVLPSTPTTELKPEKKQSPRHHAPDTRPSMPRVEQAALFFRP